MCADPATLGMMAVGGQAAGGIVSAYGAKTSSEAQATNAMYGAAVARNNSIIAEQNAEYATQKGMSQEEISRMRTGLDIGTARASMGASGVRLGGDTPARVVGDIAATGELDAETIRNNAAREAYGYRMQGANFSQQAQLDTMEAGQDIKAGKINVLTSLISGASSAGGKYASFSNAGVFS